jgi:predicted small metal-binding protein
MEPETPDRYEISCASLGIVGCQQQFQGETPGEVIDKVSDHLRAEHDIDLPEREVILRGSEDLGVEAVVGRFMSMGYSKRAILVMRRLRELLNVRAPSQDEPAI